MLLDYPTLREQLWELQALLFEETNKKYVSMNRVAVIENEIQCLLNLMNALGFRK